MYFSFLSDIWFGRLTTFTFDICLQEKEEEEEEKEKKHQKKTNAFALWSPSSGKKSNVCYDLPLNVIMWNHILTRLMLN